MSVVQAVDRPPPPSDGPLRRAHPDSEWLLAPEGAAVHPAERVAVIADVHLGYEWSRGSGGDQIPAHSLMETQKKLARLLARNEIIRLVVAGDVLESARPCLRSLRDLHALKTWVQAQGIELICLRGNHDPPQSPAWPWTAEIAGWTVGHGHRKLAGPRLILGHHHPALRAGAWSAPCFLAGRDLILLPAFSTNAAGLDLATAGLPGPFRTCGLRCYVGARDEVLDFGPLETLRSRLQQANATPPRGDRPPPSRAGSGRRRSGRR